MFEQEITAAKGLTIPQADNPVLRELLKCYADEIVPPYAARALTKTLDPSRTGCVWQVN